MYIKKIRGSLIWLTSRDTYAKYPHLLTLAKNLYNIPYNP